MKRLEQSVDSFAGKRLVIVGDLVADEYIHGTTSRLSREAPVIIVREDRREIRPGGGANVVANVRAMGGVPVPVGLVGEDPAGRDLLQEMKRLGVSTELVVCDRSRFTTTKTRVMGGGRNTVRQQMLRIDRLNEGPVSRMLMDELVMRLESALHGASGLVVSDYGEGVVAQGVFERILAVAEAGRYPVFVDSRHRVHEFLGVATLTPNEPELARAFGQEVAGEDSLEKAGRWLLQTAACRAVLVKRGRNGMALFEPDRPTVFIPAYGSDEVADVTGAGDTVLAAYSLACVAGLEASDAMELANRAGGIQVTKSGTAVVTAEELQRTPNRKS